MTIDLVICIIYIIVFFTIIGIRFISIRIDCLMCDIISVETFFKTIIQNISYSYIYYTM